MTSYFQDLSKHLKTHKPHKESWNVRMYRDKSGDAQSYRMHIFSGFRYTCVDTADGLLKA